LADAPERKKERGPRHSGGGGSESVCGGGGCVTCLQAIYDIKNLFTLRDFKRDKNRLLFFFLEYT
jgi:hypothetical protein